MKHLTLILLLFCASIVTAQEEIASVENFNFPPEKFQINLSNLTTDDAFKLVEEWVIKNFNNSSDIITNQKCGEFIKLVYTENDLYEENSYLFSTYYFDVKYEMVFNFDENSLTVGIMNVQADFPKTMTTGGWQDLTFSNKDVFKKNGERNIKLIKSITSLQDYFSDLVLNVQTDLNNSENSIVVTSLN